MIYGYRCIICNYCVDVVKSLAEIDRVEKCPHDDYPMSRQISAAAVVGDYPGYECPISGKWIEGRRAHEENLKKHGCRVFESGETDDARRVRESAENNLLEGVSTTVGQIVESMPQDKVEALAIGLQNGLDFTTTRSSVQP